MFSTAISGMTQKLKLAYAQITFNWVTVAFFLFSFIHCFSQGIIQSFLFSIDSEFAGLVNNIVHTANIPLKNITYVDNHDVLRMCTAVPQGPQSPCMVLFASDVNVPGPEAAELDASRSRSINQDLHSGFSLSPDFSSVGVPGRANGVLIKSTTADPVSLSPQCAQTLVFPQQELQKSVREDLTSIFLQFWLFGVSVFAVGQSSVPHILTALGTRLITTSWSAYIVIFRTRDQESRFHKFISGPGTPCEVELFPAYFGMRFSYNVADLVLSSTGLFLCVLLSWNLLKVFNARSFKRVGAPAHIIRIHRFFMAIQACLQLEVFALVAGTSLWVDVLLNTGIRDISTHTKIYDGLIISTALLVVPWIVLGWYGILRENKVMMISFLGIAFWFIAGWSIMFYSIVYRWTFVQWPYLGCFTVASFVLIIASVILGTICWRNFGKGLAQYLHAEAALASSNFAPEVFDHRDVEKSGDCFYAYDEPEYPMPTFQPAPSHLRSGSVTVPQDASRMPVPLRGPPPVYERPFNAF